MRAVAFSRYLETHARRIYAAGSQNEVAAAKAILARVKRGDLTDGFTARDVHQRGWSNLANIDGSRPDSNCWSIWDGLPTKRSSVPEAVGRLASISLIRSVDGEAGLNAEFLPKGI